MKAEFGPQLVFPKVSLVFIYDFPNDIETYIHRVGRTGRNGRPGRAVSLFIPQYWNGRSPAEKGSTKSGSGNWME